MTRISCLYLLLSLTACVAVKKSSPNKKFGPDQLKQDYTLFRNILEAQHPGLYWYTTKDSIDFYFAKGESMLQDSLTEPGFRKVLSYVIAKMKCGHTTVRSSKAMAKQNSGKYFPLVIKTWPDTAIVTSNLNRGDSLVHRGVLLTAIDNKPLKSILDTMFQYISADGYNLTHKYQTLSSRGVFGGLYTSLFGVQPKYTIRYTDSLGQAGSASVSLYTFKKDTTQKGKRLVPKPSVRERKKERMLFNRALRFDTGLHTAYMDLNTFTKGYHLPLFFHRSFKKLEKRGTKNLVIDLRSNGGGSVTNSNLLTKYIIDKPFKIADSLYALKRGSGYSRYANDRFSNWVFMHLMTHKKKDGHYHFSYYEKKQFKPKHKNHFEGQVYVLTGGNTFSASTLFALAVRDQNNVTLVGEETGGGAYGNNAWLIPDVTLPITKVRFRLPLFRLVINKDAPKTGRGVLPEVEALPTVQDIRKNRDFKMDKVKELIGEGK